MRLIAALIFVGLAASASAQQAPWARADVAISNRDRVYAADQTSNTVSVIDPATNTLLGVIRLGDPVPGALSPLYRGELLVHGLGYSPDSKTLAVVSVGSNSVTLIDTTTNTVKGKVYVGRSPHEAFFTRDGGELWVTVRGEDYVSVIDPMRMIETRRIALTSGPGMTMFSPDGHYGFVCSSFTPELAVVDTVSHDVIARQPQASPFCPNIALSPENDEVWITLKDIGKTQVFAATPPFAQKALLDTGPITNHVNFANNRNGRFAYVTVGGSNQVKVYRRDGATPVLVATIPVGDLPHGLWPSGDGTRIYVALENGGAAVVIDTISNKVVATIPLGQTTQALVYVPNAVPDGSPNNLLPLGQAADTAHLRLVAGGTALPRAEASVAVNSLGLLDLVQIAAAGLTPKTQYRVFLAASDRPPFLGLEPLAILATNEAGAGIVQAVGPLKTLAPEPAGASGGSARRFLIVTTMNDASDVVLRSQPEDR